MVDAALAEPQGWLSAALDAVARTADKLFEAVQAQQVEQQQQQLAAALAMPRRPCPRMAAMAQAAAADAAADAQANAPAPLVVVALLSPEEGDAPEAGASPAGDEDVLSDTSSDPDWDGVAAAFDEEPVDDDEWVDAAVALALAGACAAVLLSVGRRLVQLRADEVRGAQGYAPAAVSEAEATARKLGTADDVLIVDESDLEAASGKGEAARLLVVVARKP